MKRIISQFRRTLPRWASLAMSAVAVWALLGAGFNSDGVAAFGSGSGSEPLSPLVICPSDQCFHDVPQSNPFYTTTNNLYLDSIISGYPCGGPNEPCDRENRPYYRPNNDVNRGQMSKFVDNGRKNISDAIGHSLYISTTAGIAVDAETRSGGEAVYAECLNASNNCYAIEGYAPTGDYAGYMYGGKGVYVESDDPGYPALEAHAYSTTNYNYGIDAESANRAGYFRSDGTANYSLYVDAEGGPTQGTPALDVRGTIHGEGDLLIDGSKAGYVVDVMQNVGSEALERGDVVSIVGNGPAVLGQIPVVLVKKATSAYDTGVAGVVDEVMYVPDPATKAAYDKEQADWSAASDKRNQAMAAANAAGTKPDLSNIVMPQMTITDEQGDLHAIPDATQVPPNGYATVVTLGSFKALKVDASFGAIHAGDLLTTSPHAGYAMKVTDKSQAFGATIGKALGDLDTGTGIIPVMVTLK